MPTSVSRELNGLELDAYHLWFSRLNFYPSVLRLLLGITKKNSVYSAILEYLGEVPPQNSQEVLSYINSRRLTPLSFRIRNSWWLRLKKSVFMACLIQEATCLKDASLNRKLVLNKIMSFYPHMFSRYFHSATVNSQSLEFIDPINFAKRNQEFTNFLEFDNVKLSGCGLILSGKTVTSMDYGVLESDFAAGLWDKIEFLGEGNSCNLINGLSQTKPLGSIEEAIDLTGRTSGNYWHFMLEILPRLVGRLSQTNFIGIPLLVNADAPISCQDALRRMLPTSQIIAIKSDAWISVGKLHSPLYLTKALDSGKLYPEAKFTWDPEAYLPALNLIRAWGVPYQDRSSKRSKIFVTRNSSYRNIEGAELLEAYLRGLGFTIIDPSQLSFSEQILEFGNASLVVGFGGAVWANLLFVRPDTKVVSIISRASAPNDVHLQISYLLGLDFNRVMCDLSEVKRERFFSGIFFRDFTHSDFRIDQDMLANLTKEF
jgi:hypothetical protein